jgi:hypothetical protein
MLCLHYTLCLMQLSFVHNLILVGFSDWFPASGLLVIDAVGWRSMYFDVMPRVNLIVILSTYARYLYSINCPTVICLPSMHYLSYGETPLVNCWPRSYFLYIAITCLLYSHYLLYSHITTVFHSIRSFLCLQQTGEIDNFIVSWKQSIWLCCVQVPCCSWQSKALDETPYKLSGVVAKLASITFLSLAFSGFDKPWFLTEGKVCCCTHHTFLLGFSTGQWFTSTHRAASPHRFGIRVILTVGDLS